jgi:hypothetical protein
MQKSWVAITDCLILQVIDQNPSFDRIVSNFRGEDYQKIAATTLVSLPFGYLAGTRYFALPVHCIRGLIFSITGTSRLPLMRFPSMGMAGAIGLLGGFCLAYQVLDTSKIPCKWINDWIVDSGVWLPPSWTHSQ